MKTIVWAFLIILTISGCATGINRGNFAIISDRNMERIASGSIVAGEDQTCKSVYSKRIFYAAFLLPMNEIKPDELKVAIGSEKSPYALRFRELIYPSDIALSTLGFLAGFLTITKEIDICPTNKVMVSATESRMLKAMDRFDVERQRLSALGVPVAFRVTKDGKEVHHRVVRKPSKDGESLSEEISGVIETVGSSIKIRTEKGSQSISGDDILLIEVIIPE